MERPVSRPPPLLERALERMRASAEGFTLAREEIGELLPYLSNRAAATALRTVLREAAAACHEAIALAFGAWASGKVDETTAARTLDTANSRRWNEIVDAAQRPLDGRS